MALRFREGNRERTEFQADMGLSGLGLIGEGPLGDDRGSWMFALRRSYLDVLTEALDVGILPRYSDYQGKVVWDVGRSHRLTALGVVGVDDVELDRNESASIYGTTEALEYAGGVNWRFLWGDEGVSETSLSHNRTTYTLDYIDEYDELPQVANHEDRRSTQIRNVNRVKLGRAHEFEVGGEFKWSHHEVEVFQDVTWHPFGYVPIDVDLADTVSDNSYALFTTYTVHPVEWFDVSFGLRYDRFEFTQVGHVAPRVNVGVDVSERTRLKGAFGVYYQELPKLVLLQDDEYRDLPTPQATHYVLAVEHRPAPSTRLTLEGYYKGYDRFPMDRATPELFVVDEVVYDYQYSWFRALTDSGRARSYGVEFVCQSKLVSAVHGFAGVGWSRSEYEGLDGEWRDRVIDSDVMLTLELGMRPSERWDIGMRLVYASGHPYTPKYSQLESPDRPTSVWAGYWDRTQVNEWHYDAYQSLDVRVDRRFQFDRSNLIVYVSVWNVLNNPNRSAGYSELLDEEDMVVGIVPIMGVEFEF
jgi:outer membrane receptor protein involved in Fe transport